MRVVTLSLVGLAVLATATGAAAATENAPPFASAGLDQTVPPDSTVYLDANGSSDPDGEITGYEWVVETPTGTTRRPDCGTCRQTTFDVDSVGEYAVTLTVTDDDGATSSDTLYVTVERDAGPRVSLSGPETSTPDSQSVFTATATASGENASLRTLAWVVDGDVRKRASISGSDATRSLTRTFDTTGELSVSAVVYDTLGRRGTASQTVTVRSTGGGLGTGNGCGPDGDTWAGLCTGGGDALISTDGTQYILDSNGEPGVQLPADNGDGFRTYADPTSSESISRRTPGSDLYLIADGVSVSDALDRTDSGQEENSGSSSASVDTTQSGPDGFDNDEKADDNETITDTTKNVLNNLGITVPHRQPADSSARNGDSSDDDSGDNDDDSHTGNDNSGDSDSNDDDTSNSAKTKTGSNGSSDKGGTSGKRVSSSGFVGL
jgi:hypothetical protein